MNPPHLRFAAPASLAGVGAPVLSPTAVHVWGFELDAPATVVTGLAALLPREESERAARFATTELCARYIVAHGVLRHVLAAYSGGAPQALRFDVGAHGKPYLASRTLHFNLSHSADRAVIAVARGFEIGVDLEAERAGVETGQIAHRFFFGSEAAAVASGGATAFFRYWVAKEAVLKGVGLGLTLPLDRFAIEFAPDGGEASVRSFDLARLGPDWRVRMITAEAGWYCAIAAAGDRWTVVIR